MTRLQSGSIFGDSAIDEGRKKVEQYLSIPSSAFLPAFPDIDDVAHNVVSMTFTNLTPGSVIVAAPVFLPHGAIVTSAQVFGDAALANRTWAISEVAHDNLSSNTIATANVNTEALANQSYSDVENDKFKYIIYTVNAQDGDVLYGARITYTI